MIRFPSLTLILHDHRRRQPNKHPTRLLHTSKFPLFEAGKQLLLVMKGTSSFLDPLNRVPALRNEKLLTEPTHYLTRRNPSFRVNPDRKVNSTSIPTPSIASDEQFKTNSPSKKSGKEKERENLQFFYLICRDAPGRMGWGRRRRFQRGKNKTRTQPPRTPIAIARAILGGRKV
ncbi:hypothetical protein MLD38_034421 [Melastoma candidum]|uniref:Uncharacterized protein n=1 Tax=Melastoma candidum TaxID=119954 RepID=A0ACB9MBR4_9MYRT|nr:hypothetical protein MLD38_034421 [Melastoma candidum]